MPSSVDRWFQTVRRLRPVQVANRFTRRLPKRASVSLPAVRERAGIWTEGTGFQPEEMTRESRLRDYLAHYHYCPGAAAISQWIGANPPAAGTGWEPYPVSLRTVNWVKWLLEGEGEPDGMLPSLAGQIAHLSGNVEYHLLANHLFANAKALVFGGAFFQRNGWLDQGLKILRKEVAEQICADGGHFERSPMYHCLILEDLLDLVNLGNAYPGLLPDWRGPAARMLGWLREMTHPDGRIAFFNDATFGAAPEPEMLFDYASRLGVAPVETGLSDSGYVRLENEESVVLSDAGPVGPDYQPGHAHCDTLSFELSHRGKRVLVNSGISTYERDAERHEQRSTAAHNTVVVDGEEQSEIWAAFRVARRAYPLDVKTDGRTWVEAAHNGYRRLPSPVTHRRRLELKKDRLLVSDTLEGRGVHSAAVHFHQHPEASAAIELDAQLERGERATGWQPGFDRSVPNRTVTGHWSGECPATFLTKIILP